MLSKNKLKLIHSLRLKKHRLEQQLFLVEGEKNVEELLHSQLQAVELFAVGEWILSNRLLLQDKAIAFQEITPEELARASELVTPNKVVAIARMPEYRFNTELLQGRMLLALDGIRDPGNMGTIIRTADWFGIEDILCSLDCVDLYNPKVIQATMGSFTRTRVHYTDLTAFLKSISGKIPIFGALLDGPSLHEKKFSSPGVLVIGSESHGISGELLPLISDPVYIPRSPGSPGAGRQAESLNASIANAIICFEIRKQLSENKF